MAYQACYVYGYALRKDENPKFFSEEYPKHWRLFTVSPRKIIFGYEVEHFYIDNDAIKFKYCIKEQEEFHKFVNGGIDKNHGENCEFINAIVRTNTF